jgi:hypothetical protein
MHSLCRKEEKLAGSHMHRDDESRTPGRRRGRIGQLNFSRTRPTDPAPALASKIRAERILRDPSGCPFGNSPIETFLRHLS